MTAQESFQTFLDAISMCFIHRDFEMWRSRVIYPVSLITSAGPNIINDDAQLQVNFELYLRACDAMKLDKIYRTPLSLEDCHDGHWIGTYETNMLSRGVRATLPYTSSVLLQEVDGRFKMTSVLNARGHHDWTGTQPPVYD